MCVGPLSEQVKKEGKDIQLKFYKVMSVLTLMYGSVKLVLTNRSLQSIESTEMRFLRFGQRTHKTEQNI
jgi:hypothetical protein